MLKILVTEDSPDIQYLYQSVLADMPCQIDFADSIKDSRKKFYDQRYDIAFFDVDLNHPEVTGRDLLAEYRRLYPKATAYIASSHKEPQIYRFCQRHNARLIEKSRAFVSEIRAACKGMHLKLAS